MPTKAFSLASWNVEHFTYHEKEEKTRRRVDRVVNFLRDQDPDVFGLYEVKGKEVFNQLTKKMPDYQFFITEGRATQEILAGVRQGFTAFFTQKTEFQSGNTFLRPGLLVTLRVDGTNYSILFLHTKSSRFPVGLGIRDDMFGRAFKFRREVLDPAAGGKANFMFVGDLNTMGMDYPFKRDILATIEIRKLRDGAQKARMRVLAKDMPHTWWNGKTGKLKPSDLDHVVASEHLRFIGNNGADVAVRGWPLLPKSQQSDWIREYSDHGLLYLEVAK